jgi:hypothetical protein
MPGVLEQLASDARDRNVIKPIVGDHFSFNYSLYGLAQTISGLVLPSGLGRNCPEDVNAFRR